MDGKSAGDILLSVGRQALGAAEPARGRWAWASFEALVKDEWKGLARQGGRERAFVEFWEESLRRGGVWREAAPQAVALRADAARAVKPAAARGQRHARAARVPVGALLRRARRRSAVAAGSARTR